MSRYSVGADFERTVRRTLESEGYLVIRSAGSKSPVDLVCFRAGEVIFVQCKTNGVMGKVEREQLKELARDNNCQARLYSKQGRKIVWENLQSKEVK
jgi:Holliday junction resolvase